MTTSLKAALSLLISVVLVAGFSALAFTGFLNLVETRFYNPSITNFQNKEVRRDTDTIQNYFEEMKKKFSEILRNDAVQQSFIPTQSGQDIFERARLYGQLMESEKGLQSVRFIDAGGLRIHFSTSPTDILNQTNNSITYKNYNDVTPFTPYAELAVPQGEPDKITCKITMDQRNERIIFSFPFMDSLDIYRGTAMYSLSVRALEDQLIMEGRIKAGENLSIISVPPGIVSGLPNTGREALLSVISSVWQEGIYQHTSLNSQGSTVVLFSARTNQEFIVGRVVSESLFDFPQIMKTIILLSVFLTIFLTVFLIFNLRPDTITVVQTQLKRLQLSLIRDYYERKGEIDWNLWRHELEQRREDVRTELKRGIKNKPTPLLKDIDILIDKSWDEILDAIGNRRETRLAIDEDKLQNILSRMLLAAGSLPAAQSAAQLTIQSSAEEDPEELEELEELSGDDNEPEELAEEELDGTLEEDEELEELAEVEEFAEAEELEELNDADEVSELPSGLFDLGIELGVDVEELTLDDLKSDEAPHATANYEDIDASAFSPSVSSVPIADKASEIEFDVFKEQNNSLNKEDSLRDIATDVEIVSPLSEMLSPFEEKNNFYADDDGGGGETKTSGRLEELSSDFTMSLVYKPFQNEGAGEIQELPPAGTGVIRQKNGVHYVNKDVKSPNVETVKTLDPGLKNLVDSVLGKK
ncbi:MAG: hypothetical protein LBB72_04250 [Spirochaetaceae bacterium]|nr:hypothetical protein [Spirochaetaceae bacterium]